MSRPGTERLKVNPPQGAMPVLQYLTPHQLQIDPTYQRTLETEASKTLVRQITQHWNWDLCQVLVVARRGDGALYVIDGQHRLEAAKRRGDIMQLPAVVVQYASQQDEAAAFVHLNQARKPLTKIDLFKAAVASADGEALAIVQAIADAGLKIAPHSNHTAWKPGMISNIGGIEKCWRTRGAVVTRIALKALGEALGHTVLQYCGTLFPGIAAIVSLETDGGKVPWDDELWRLMIDMVRERDQAGWRKAIMAAKAENPSLKFGAASETVFLAAWQELLAKEFDFTGRDDHTAGVDDGETDAGAPDEPDDDPDSDETDEAPDMDLSALPPMARSVAPIAAPPVSAAPPPPVAKPVVKEEPPRGKRPAVNWGQVTTAVRRTGMPKVITPRYDKDGKTWCGQCDCRRSKGEVAGCISKFCPFQVRA
jgi:hypothetical protein